MPYNSYDVILENLILNQPALPKFIFSIFSSLVCLISYWCRKQKLVGIKGFTEVFRAFSPSPITTLSVKKISERKKNPWHPISLPASSKENNPNEQKMFYPTADNTTSLTTGSSLRTVMFMVTPWSKSPPGRTPVGLGPRRRVPPVTPPLIAGNSSP